MVLRWALALGAIGATVGIPLAFVARSKIRTGTGALEGSGPARATMIVGAAWRAMLLIATALATFLGATARRPSIQTLDAGVSDRALLRAPDRPQRDGWYAAASRATIPSRLPSAMFTSTRWRPQLGMGL